MASYRANVKRIFPDAVLARHSRRHSRERRGDPIRQAGGSAARWRTLDNVMDISTIDTSAPRARQLRDEPQSGYSTRGYQQRQPSLKRAAAGQTDLKNESTERAC